MLRKTNNKVQKGKSDHNINNKHASSRPQRRGRQQRAEYKYHTSDQSGRELVKQKWILREGFSQIWCLCRADD